MALDWPRMVLVDAERDRHARWIEAARELGQAPRALPAIPTSRDKAQDSVRLLIVRSAEPPEQIVRLARSAFPRARLVVVRGDSAQEAAIEAFRAGADDFIRCDADPDQRVALLARHLSADDATAQDHGGLVGDSARMRELRGFIRRLAPSGATVLITGETGTGKDRAALLLHRLSRRSKGPLVALNCAAIPEALLEGELFGYERGAFSGALSAYPGKLKLADGGTLFLDEIGELSLAGQAKVLRAIETRQAYRLGARTPTSFDARIVAATNRDLRQEMAAGRFREDLYYRLAVAHVAMPPLRERLDDVGTLTRYLLDDLAHAAGIDVPRVDPAAMEALEAHRWPGNVRELRNALEVALVSAEDGRIRPRDLPPGMATRSATPARPLDERARLLDVLARSGGNKSLAAQELNCSRMTLYRKLARYGLAEDAELSGVTVTSDVSVSPGLSHQL